jgi:hypothetical protein
MVNKKKKKTWKKEIKEEEPKINFLTHKLLASTLSYLMLTSWWYSNHSNLFLRIALMLSLIFLYISFYYQFDLLPHHEPVTPWNLQSLRDATKNNKTNYRTK